MRSYGFLGREVAARCSIRTLIFLALSGVLYFEDKFAGTLEMASSFVWVSKRGRPHDERLGAGAGGRGD